MVNETIGWKAIQEGMPVVYTAAGIPDFRYVR